MDKQRSANIRTEKKRSPNVNHKKTEGARRCSTSGARCATLATNHVLSHEGGKNKVMMTTSRTYPWSFMTQIFRCS